LILNLYLKILKFIICLLALDLIRVYLKRLKNGKILFEFVKRKSVMLWLVLILLSYYFFFTTYVMGKGFIFSETYRYISSMWVCRLVKNNFNIDCVMFCLYLCSTKLFWIGPNNQLASSKVLINFLVPEHKSGTQWIVKAVVNY